MADPNQQGGGGGGGGDQQKQKGGGGGGGAKNGVSLSGNIDAAAMGVSWPAVKKSLADQSLNAAGFIVAGVAIFVLKKAAYKLFGIDADTVAKPKPNPWEGAQAIRDMRTNQPDKYKIFAEKNKDLFEAPSIDVTPKAE